MTEPSSPKESKSGDRDRRRDESDAFDSYLLNLSYACQSTRMPDEDRREIAGEVVAKLLGDPLRRIYDIPKENLRPFVRRVTRNLVVDRVRCQARRSTEPLIEDVISNERADPLERLMNTETVDEIVAIAQGLGGRAPAVVRREHDYPACRQRYLRRT